MFTNTYCCSNRLIICLQMHLVLVDVEHGCYPSGSIFNGKGRIPFIPLLCMKELFPIVLACAVWGHQWTETYIMCHSDNEATVSQVNRLHARDHLAFHLLCCLGLFTAKFDFRLRAVHIAGKLNIGAPVREDLGWIWAGCLFPSQHIHDMYVQEATIIILCSSIEILNHIKLLRNAFGKDDGANLAIFM